MAGQTNRPAAKRLWNRHSPVPKSAYTVHLHGIEDLLVETPARSAADVVLKLRLLLHLDHVANDAAPWSFTTRLLQSALTDLSADNGTDHGRVGGRYPGDPIGSFSIARTGGLVIDFPETERENATLASFNRQRRGFATVACRKPVAPGW